ncbi:MAG TPA: NHL repeat-containing protein [Acidobacteriaceae bacterium]|jgi:streptogramin lyase|nr:NHL repeat-containing protein [Acidobacteriaceae bacterium]
MRTNLFRTLLFAFTGRFCCVVAALAAFGVGAQGQTGTFPAGGVNLGSVAVNTGTPAKATLTFTFTAGGTIAAPAVVTQGAKDLDFTDAGTGTCTTNGTGHSYSAGDVCTVVVKFAPQFAGVRYGAVVLYNSTNAPIATGYIYGAGTGPQAAYFLGTDGPEVDYTPVAEIQLGGRGINPYGVVVGGDGTIYFADTVNNAVKKMPAGCVHATCVTTLGGGFDQPWGVALDGSGNVYVADTANNAVKEMAASCISSTCVTALGGGFNTPRGVAVDSSGKIYVADELNNAVDRMPQGCASSSCVEKLAGVGYPLGVAVDGAGNVYVAGYDTVVEIPAGCASNSCTKTVGGIFSLFYGNPSGPETVAVDPVGNVYATGGPNILLWEIPAGCVSFDCMIEMSGGGTGGSLYGVGFDGGGNIYFAAGGGILEEVRASPPPLTFAATGAGQTSSDSPQTVSVQNVGNALLSLSNITYPTDFPEAADVATDCTSSTDLSAGSSCTLSIDFSPSPASLTSSSTALSEQVSLADNTLNGSSVEQSVPVTGAALGPAMLAYGTPPATSVALGGNAGNAITVDVELPNGVLVTPSAASITLTVTYPDTTTKTYTRTAVNGVATFNLSAESLTELGGYTYTASSTELTSATASETVEDTFYTAPTISVGSASAVQTATVSLGSHVTLGSIGVVTQGAPNLDFRAAMGGTCTAGTAYTAGQTCTVKYKFDPTRPGTRYGAVVLYDNAVPANAVATAYLQGTGTGPQVVFNPATVKVPGGLENYNAVTADTSGNLYVAGSAGVQEIPHGCASSVCMTTLGGGFSNPQALAVDGGGNIYVGDTGNYAVKEIPPGCASASCVITLGGSFNNGPYTGPSGVAVDGSGNVYVAAQIGGAKEIPHGCSSSGCVVTLPGSYPNALGVAVDGSGNVYVVFAESPKVGVSMIPAGCASSTCILNVGGHYSLPVGIAIDGTGHVFVADWGEHTIDEVPVACESASCVTTLFAGSFSYFPQVVAVDGGDNVYVIASPSNLVRAGALNELDRADGPSVTFAPTADGQTSKDSPQTVTVQNIGNEPLSFPVPASGNNPGISANFSLNSTGAGACPVTASGAGSAGMLAADASCTLAISFSPGSATYGNVSGSLLLTDDNLNAAAPGYATQAIALSGAANPPMGGMTPPVDATTRSTTVAQSDNALFAGWAADPHDGAPVSEVSVLIDGTAVGNATLGLLRPDIASAYNNLAYSRSGWTLTYPAASLAIGKHAVTAVITDSLGLSTSLGPRSFSVAAAAVAGAPFGAIGQPMDAVTHATTVAQADSLVVDGWAADAHDGAPVASVSVLIDGSAAGNATLGIARPDVAAGQGSAYLDSGWTFTYSAAGLSVGSHTVSAMATDSLGNATQFATKAFTVSATQVAGPPFGSVGKAVDATTGLTTVSASDTLLVAGWAADFHDGAPVASVTVLIDGAAAGAATLGVARPDVVQGLGNAAYLHAGWTFSYPASGLSAGAHTVTAVAADSLGMSTQLEIRSFTVSP